MLGLGFGSSGLSKLSLGIWTAVLNMDSDFFDVMVGEIRHPWLRLSDTGVSNAAAFVLDLHLSTSYCVVATEICDEQGCFILLLLAVVFRVFVRYYSL